MPNWVENRVHISGPSNIITPLKEFLASDESEFDFRKIVSPKDEEAYRSSDAHDSIGWYSWNCNNWGTKWNACDVVTDFSTKGDRSELSYGFSTAWSNPEPIMDWLFDFAYKFACDFLWYYEEEQGWGGEITLNADGTRDRREWDIPSSHEDYKTLDRDCICDWNDDTSDWFDDCPREPRGYLSP